MTTARISPRPLWNVTEIVLQAGRKYDIEASGTWVDFYIPCGPGGYPCPSFLSAKLRYPNAKLFQLIGSIDSDENLTFVIGSSIFAYSPSKSGRLTCFANDLACMYWNNWGAIEVTVTERE